MQAQGLQTGQLRAQQRGQQLFMKNRNLGSVTSMAGAGPEQNRTGMDYLRCSLQMLTAQGPREWLRAGFQGPPQETLAEPASSSSFLCPKKTILIFCLKCKNKYPPGAGRTCCFVSSEQAGQRLHPVLPLGRGVRLLCSARRQVGAAAAAGSSPPGSAGLAGERLLS